MLIQGRSSSPARTTRSLTFSGVFGLDWNSNSRTVFHEDIDFLPLFLNTQNFSCLAGLDRERIGTTLVDWAWREPCIHTCTLYHRHETYEHFQHLAHAPVNDLYMFCLRRQMRDSRYLSLLGQCWLFFIFHAPVVIQFSASHHPWLRKAFPQFR